MIVHYIINFLLYKTWYLVITYTHQIKYSNIIFDGRSKMHVWCHIITPYISPNIIFKHFLSKKRTNYNSFIQPHHLIIFLARSSAKIMRFHSLQVLILLIMVILISSSHLSSCRDIVHASHQTTKQNTTSDRFKSRFSWYFPAPSPKGSRNGVGDSSYRESLRKTPGGSNPLHNWQVSCKG